MGLILASNLRHQQQVAASLVPPVMFCPIRHGFGEPSHDLHVHHFPLLPPTSTGRMWRRGSRKFCGLLRQISRAWNSPRRCCLHVQPLIYGSPAPSPPTDSSACSPSGGIGAGGICLPGPCIPVSCIPWFTSVAFPANRRVSLRASGCPFIASAWAWARRFMYGPVQAQDYLV